MAEYKVHLSVFEGPLDLLLYLIKKEEVDIYEVNLTRIATQFIEHVEMMRRLDLDVAGEFLVMAATLMYIKSRELLPVDQQVKVEEDEDQIDPRWDLIRQLVEYKKFKDMAAQLQARELEMSSIYGRQPGQLELFAPETEAPSQVSIMDLIQAVGAILKRFQEPEKPGVISEDKWTVSEKIQLIVERIQSGASLMFSELFATARSRSEVIATFLAMLELTRLKKLLLFQTEPFGDIEMRAAPPESAHPPESAADEAPVQVELDFSGQPRPSAGALPTPVPAEDVEPSHSAAAALAEPPLAAEATESAAAETAPDPAPVSSSADLTPSSRTEPDATVDADRPACVNAAPPTGGDEPLDDVPASADPGPQPTSAEPETPRSQDEPAAQPGAASAAPGLGPTANSP